MTVELTWWFLWGLLIALFGGLFVVPLGALSVDRAGRYIFIAGVTIVLVGLTAAFGPGVSLV